MTPRSIPGVVEVIERRGTEEARSDRPPGLVIELPHGATERSTLEQLRARLHGRLPDRIERFFFVNTDVGSPELAEAAAAAWLERNPTRRAILLRCCVPRTLVDCNRVLGGDRSGTTLTPGLQPYIDDPRDRALLRGLHEQWAGLASAAFTQVCQAGGLGLMLHTYAPRSVGVTVEHDIVEQLERAYLPGTVEGWPLRPEADLICRTPEGEQWAPQAWVDGTVAELAAAGVRCGVGETYPLHPATLGAQHAGRFRSQTLCVEVRRDLVMKDWQPFVPLAVDEEAVARIGGAIGRAVPAV